MMNKISGSEIFSFVLLNEIYYRIGIWQIIGDIYRIQYLYTEPLLPSLKHASWWEMNVQKMKCSGKL